MTRKKKRKIKIERLLLVIVAFALFVTLLVLLIKGVLFFFDKDEYVFDENSLNITTLNYEDSKELDIDLYSNSYIVIRLNDMNVCYSKNVNDRFYPASLTKVLTLNTVCRNFSDFGDTSSISNLDYEELIVANASLAGIKTNYDYSLDDLLYALILSSGADASRALENYFEDNSLNLVDEMNRVCIELGLSNSHFTNTTGLHDEDLYTTLDDYARIVIDTLKYNEGKAVLKAFSKTLSDGTLINSTLSSLADNGDEIAIYGGKTGFTGEAGENIMVLFEIDNESYLIVLQGADGNPYIDGQDYHLKDASNIIDYLYNE